MDPAQPLAVVGVVGASGAGKTTLLTRLVPLLRARGLAVGVVKHASHGFDADRPGKDSRRAYEAGADAVALISCDQVATFARREAGAPRLAEALAALPPDLDVALVEGFSWEPIPRVVIAARGDSRLRTHLLSGEVLAVHTAAAGGGAPPRFETGWLEALVEAIAARARRARRAPPRRRASPAEIPRAPASGETPRL